MKNKVISVSIIISFILGLVACKNTDYSIKNPAPIVGQSSDYSMPQNWFKIPDSCSHDVDVIYFYPTTVYHSNNENTPMICDIDDNKMHEAIKDCYDSQASVFETVGDIYIPYYRQLTVEAFEDMTQEDIYSYISREPRTDVFGALDYYFENFNNNRPFILAGHSQGSMMLSMVLSEYMKKHTDYMKRMIVAYQIGYSLTNEFLKDNPQIKAASSSDDTGVIVSFNVEAPNNIRQNNLVVLNDSVCINPLTWSTDDTHASKNLNKGSRIANANGQFELIQNFADAKINNERGSIICTSIDPDIYAVKDPLTSIFGPGSYHTIEYGLYYMNIRENAQTRVESYLNNLNN